MRWPWITPQKSALTQEQDRRFSFAVVGLGHGAHKFLEALQDSPSTRVAALVSRDAGKARGLSRRFAVPAVYTEADFDRIAEDAAVDAVYLCLPNFLHRAWAERAARAGKHVLCEKPLAPTAADCEAMISACRAANRLLMTGYRLLFSSVHQRAAELLQGGSLGEVLSVRSAFGFVAKPGWRTEPGLPGSGSLCDVGIYALNTLSRVFPQGFSIYHAEIRHSVSGVEMAATWRGRLNENGAPIECRSSFSEKLPDTFEVETTYAKLTLAPAFSYQGLHLQVRAKGASHRALNLSYKAPRSEPSPFRLEAEHLARCARFAEPLHSPGEMGLRDVVRLEEILRVAGTQTT